MLSGDKPTIWITGAAGFLGSRLVKYFQNRGCKVVGLSRRHVNEPNLGVSIDLSSVSVIETLQQLVKGEGIPDVLIHAASKQPGKGLASDFVGSNVVSTATLLDALKPTPPKQIIYTSTLTVYGRHVEPRVDERSDTLDHSIYGLTKRWSEQLLETFDSNSAITVLRLPSLYGKGQADSFIDGLARSAKLDEPIELFSRGEIIRDALHVTDVVKAIGSVVYDRRRSAYTIINLGSGRPTKTIEYAKVLVNALGSGSKIVPSERPSPHFDLWADIAKAHELIRFQPMTLEQSMKEYSNEL